MLSDIRPILWKEWRELLRMGGSRRRSIFRLVFSVGIIGVLWPWQVGAPFVTSKLAIVFAAFTSSMYVAGLVPDSFAGERERHTLETLLASRLPDRAILFGKIVALVTYGLCAAVVMLAMGWLTVNLLHRTDRILFYDVATLLGAIVFSIIGTGLMAAAGVLVSLRAATVKQAQQVLSTAVMILFLMPLIVISTVPAEFRDRFTKLVDGWGGWYLPVAIAAALILLQAILFAITIARFKRGRLILER